MEGAIFHLVQFLVIVLLQGFTSFYFLRTFGELYAGQDTVFFVIYSLIWLLGNGKKEKRKKLNQRGIIVEGIGDQE